MSLERSSKESLCKAVSEYVSARYPLDQYFSILYQSTYVMVHHVDVFRTILTLRVSRQSTACFIVTKHLHLSDGLIRQKLIQ